MELRVTLLLLAFLGFNAGTPFGFSLPGALTLVLVACSLPLVPGLLTLPSLARGAITGLPLRLLVCLVPVGHSRGIYRTDLRWVPIVRSCVAVPGLATRIALQERYEPHLSAHKAIKIGNVRRPGYFGLARVVVPRPSPAPVSAPVSRKVATPANTFSVVAALWLPPSSDLVLPSAPATRLVPRAVPVRGARVAKRWTAGAQRGRCPTKTTISLSASPMEGAEPSSAPPQPWVGGRDGDVEMEDVVRPEEMEASLEWLGLGRDGKESEGEEMDWSADEGVPTQEPHQSTSDDDDDDADDDNAKLSAQIDEETAAQPATQGNFTPQEADLSERLICKTCGEDPPNLEDNGSEVTCKSCGLVLAASDYMP
ncbi:transcription initiation factor IIB [Oleoguttula sp. CCFEE 5521]